MLVHANSANLAGYFASYHVYPYYPDFIDLDSANGAASAEGQSRYFGYLCALKQHHAGRPLLIAEYGVPSSRGVSHLQTDGLGHGGHDEREMAEIDARLTREVRAAGAAGGVLFAWLDEWFKHTWVTIDLEVPAERSRLWHNMEDAEQHYGLMGEYAGASADATPEPGGDPAVWRALPVLARGDSLVLRVGADPSYLYVALAGRPEFDSARYVVGIDTYRRDRGQFRLPGVAGPAGEVGSEFALVLNDTSDAQLMVAPWYNPFLEPRSGMGPNRRDRWGSVRSGRPRPGARRRGPAPRTRADLRLADLGGTHVARAPEARVRRDAGGVGGGIVVTRHVVLAFGIALVAHQLAAQLPVADEAFHRGDYAAARAGYERVLAADSSNERALYRLAILDSWDGKLLRSLARFARLRRIDPHDPDIMLTQAQVLAWAGRTAASEALYDSVLERFPDRADAP